MDPPLPPHLSDFITADYKAVDGVWNCDTGRDKIEAAWQYFNPPLRRAGFQVEPRYATRSGPRRSALWPPAVNPFQPQPYESFVGYNVCYPPFSLVYEEARVFECYRNIRTGHDTSERSVHVKLVPPKGVLAHCENSTEVGIMTFFNSGSLRDDPQNHTIPLLAHLKLHDWNILVTPTWNTPFDGHHFLAHIPELLDMGKQLLEGLSFMHRHNIAHRDISRHNILFNHAKVRSRHAYLYLPGRMPEPVDLTKFTPAYAFIDFQFASRFPGGPGTGQRASGWLGSPPFIAPEIQASYQRNDIYYDPYPADVYALGKTINSYLLDNVRICFEEYGQLETPPYCAPLTLAEYVPEYLDVLDKMTSRDPSARPSASGALEEVCTIIAHLSEDIKWLPTPRNRPDMTEGLKYVSGVYATEELRVRKSSVPEL